MPEWSLYGYDRRERFEKSLDPHELSYTLMKYQEEFGDEFGIRELLKLEEIRALALVAEAINDAPEFFMDQLGKAQHSIDILSVSESIGDIAEAIREST